MTAHAPDLAHGGSGFDPRSFEKLAELESGNFWFRARNRLIADCFQKYAAGAQSFLEVGCGTGFVLSHLNRTFPHITMYGSEIFSEGLAHAKARVPQARLMQMDARRIPYQEEFDAVGAFDVLEHIQEDSSVLEQIEQALKPKGILLITVPQHRWLWSAADTHACHVRRYSGEEIERKIRNAGFSIVRSSSFVSLLMPAMVLARLRYRNASSEYSLEKELKLARPIDAAFEAAMRLEQLLLRCGINFPIGGSRLVVARKS